MKNNDQELWNQIHEQFQKLVKESGVELDEDYQRELENALGISSEEFSNISEESAKMLSTQKIKVHRIHPDAELPKYNYPSDSGFDLHSVEEINIPAFGRALIPTGLRVQFENNFEIQVRTKSGLAINQGIMVLNSPGTVDQGYTGEIKVPIFNTNNGMVTIKKGMKVAQAVLCPVFNGSNVMIEEVDGIEEKDRGNKGFGSTGI